MLPPAVSRPSERNWDLAAHAVGWGPLVDVTAEKGLQEENSLAELGVRGINRDLSLGTLHLAREDGNMSCQATYTQHSDLPHCALVPTSCQWLLDLSGRVCFQRY